MIEESGRVIAVEDGAVWVETLRRSACQSCSARAGCGHHALDTWQSGSHARVRALCDGPVAVGDQVVLGVPEDLILRGAVLVYLVPLALLFTGALLGSTLTPGSEYLSAPLGVAGLVAGFLFNRWYSHRHRGDADLHPRVLRVKVGLAAAVPGLCGTDGDDGVRG